MIGSNNNWMHAPHQKEIAAFSKWYNENEKEKAPETAPKKQMEDFAKWAKTPEAKKQWKPPKARHGKIFLRNLRTLTRANLKRKCISKITREKPKCISKKVKVF